jgi:hypothetical protein
MVVKKRMSRKPIGKLTPVRDILGAEVFKDTKGREFLYDFPKKKFIFMGKPKILRKRK